ncbi:MAG: hypothetical protein LW826_03010 [Candidatus Jidaibacter sp.]|jgi:hypothetical protein|nr:hypothetical protein [Candidatus Jidaibacter sp.]
MTQEPNIYESRLMEAFSSPDFMLVKMLGEKLLEAGMAYIADTELGKMISPSYIEPTLTQDKDRGAYRS